MAAADLSPLLEEIEGMLREPPAGGAASVARIEERLTDGYARALSLEAERARLERRIGELARRVSEGEGAVQELARLSDRLTEADARLTRLRTVLDSLRQHAAAARLAR
jgi:uncharacterized coiled-coil protein SlyX